MSRILVTGAAGFIGMHTARALLDRGDQVIGIDNLNDYYDPTLKQARLSQLQAHAQSANFQFHRVDIADQDAVSRVFLEQPFDSVVHLAAQPGVRYSLRNPHAYVRSNVTGFLNILESVRAQHDRTGQACRHLVYASSSSVYGGNKKLPFSETDAVDHPVSLYAATKKSNELMAHTYAHLFRIPLTGLRFFTVYGPWGRPDMAPFLFTKAMLAGEPIPVFNRGNMQRDFTYIDDIVKGVIAVLDRPPASRPTSEAFAFAEAAPCRVLNIGNHRPEALMDFIASLESALGVSAKIDLQPMQPGDVVATYADTAALHALTGFAPSTPLQSGIAQFTAWYRSYYNV